MGKNIGETLFSHVKPMGVLGIFNGDLQKIVHTICFIMQDVKVRSFHL